MTEDEDDRSLLVQLCPKVQVQPEQKKELYCYDVFSDIQLYCDRKSRQFTKYALIFKHTESVHSSWLVQRLM